MSNNIHLLVLLTLAISLSTAEAQRPPFGFPPFGGPPPMRYHKIIKAQPLRPIPANSTAPGKPEVSIELNGGKRHVHSNGIPQHKIGKFPTRHNPNSVRPQNYNVDLNGNPKPAKEITSINRHDQPGPPNMPFGFAVNGIFFEPGTAEFWHGDRKLGWNYEALGGAVPLGIDENFGHVQPNGAYHYHGLPTGLLKRLGLTEEKHSPLVGWASDGYPIYARYGYKNPKDASSEIVEFQSSYQLKKGTRPSGRQGPGGKYDGAFARDYEYVAELSELDECSGRFTVTPEFPEGTYAYFLTENWPVIPRAFRGEAVNIKMHQRPGGRR